MTACHGAPCISCSRVPEQKQNPRFKGISPRQQSSCAQPPSPLCRPSLPPGQSLLDEVPEQLADVALELHAPEPHTSAPQLGLWQEPGEGLGMERGLLPPQGPGGEDPCPPGLDPSQETVVCSLRLSCALPQEEELTAT